MAALLCSLVHMHQPWLQPTRKRKPSMRASVLLYPQCLTSTAYLFILGDFNARVGRDCWTWPRVLGHHSVRNGNSNGSLLLQTCSQHELVLTNTLFQQANKYKTTWMYPRSEHWHMLDYVITRQRDVHDVHLIYVSCEGPTAGLTTDLCVALWHRDLACQNAGRHPRRRELDASMLKIPDVKLQLQLKLDELWPLISLILNSTVRQQPGTAKRTGQT